MNAETQNAKLDTMINAVRIDARDIRINGRRPRMHVVCTNRTGPDSGLFDVRQSAGQGRTNRLAHCHAQITRSGSVAIEWRA